MPESGGSNEGIHVIEGMAELAQASSFLWQK
jgi:hypothetical protein